jgi:sulfatase maturation enzyme AslB (radical SAM superfamily)
MHLEASPTESAAPGKDLSTFCVMPFSHVFANESGDMHFCCMAVESGHPIRDESGKAFSFKQPERILEAWNSPYMRGARKEMLSGKRPEACLRCFKIEESHVRSFRTDMNLHYAEILPDLISRTKQDGSIEFSPYSVDVRLGNTCNLRCRMCSPQASRGLIEEWRTIFKDVSHDWLDGQENVNWFSNHAYWDVLLSHLDNIRNFHFAGGEPLMIREMYVFLRKIIESGHASHISLSYNTNGTFLPEVLFELWPKFKSVSVLVSLDGTEKVNSYIRHPADWKKIMANLAVLDERASELNIDILKVNATIQAYNVFDLPEFLRFMITRYKRVEFPWLNLLFNPPHLSGQVLPRKMRELARARLLDFHSKFQSKINKHARSADEAERLHDQIAGVADYLVREDHEEHFGEFVRATRAFDESRNESFAELVPELAPYFEESMSVARAAP